MMDKPAQDGAAVDADRRPIATRDRAFAQQVAHWLATHGASPNGISVAGMISGILAGASLAATTLPGFAIVGFVLAAVFVQMRLLANLFDGMVAVEQNRRSLGDPMRVWARSERTVHTRCSKLLKTSSAKCDSSWAAGAQPVLAGLPAGNTCKVGLCSGIVRLEGMPPVAPRHGLGQPVVPGDNQHIRSSDAWSQVDNPSEAAFVS